MLFSGRVTGGKREVGEHIVHKNLIGAELSSKSYLVGGVVVECFDDAALYNVPLQGKCPLGRLTHSVAAHFIKIRGQD